jgi:hypothetical protein
MSITARDSVSWPASPSALSWSGCQTTYKTREAWLGSSHCPGATSGPGSQVRLWPTALAAEPAGRRSSSSQHPTLRGMLTLVRFVVRV